MFSVVTAFFCGVEIQAKTSVEVTNRFETGIVDIGIMEYQIVNGQEEAWKNNPVILPGNQISKIPRIYNYGTDCYVRVKISFRETEEITEKNLFGMSGKWMKADDGYYYYKEILKKGKTVDVFQGIEIPENLSQDMAGKSFYLDIDADAIQSKNFIPDFEAASPWGSVEILSCGKEGAYDIGIFKQADTQLFEIEYQGRIEKLVKNKDDFFANFPYLMPGDTYSDCIKIVNDDKTRELNLYFRSEAKDDSELLDKILLRITTEFYGEKKEIYYGSLRAAELSQEGLLGVLRKGAEGVFYFEIEVPKELDNKYTILDSSVKWIFSTVPIAGKPVQTGDAATAGIYTAELLSGAGMMILMRRRKRKERRVCKNGIR